jgi:ribose transport system substrate-binding protein
MDAKSVRIGFATFLLAAASAALTGGCAPQGGEAANRLSIAVIPKGETHDFWRSIHAGALAAARDIGDVEVIWQGPLREDDREQQIQVVEQFVAQGVDGIVLAPLDRRALVRPVEEAIAAGIPTLIIDSGLESDKTISYVATDNYNGGVLAARRLAEVLEGKGNVVLLRYQVGSESTEQREAGFLDTLAKEFPDITLISEDQRAGATRESATQAMEGLVAQFGEQMDGIFAPCEPVAYGCMRALEDSDLAGQVKVVGYDATPAMVEALRNGTLHGLVLQDPFKMGELGVRMMVDHLQGRAIEKRVPTGEVVVTPENIDDPRMVRLHSPDLTPYLGG